MSRCSIVLKGPTRSPCRKLTRLPSRRPSRSFRRRHRASRRFAFGVRGRPPAAVPVHRHRRCRHRYRPRVPMPRKPSDRSSILPSRGRRGATRSVFPFTRVAAGSPGRHVYLVDGAREHTYRARACAGISKTSPSMSDRHRFTYSPCAQPRVHCRRERNAPGVVPVQRTNARWKAACSVNPSS